MNILLITNNSMVFEKFSNTVEVLFFENYKYLDILNFVRDKIHEGHELLTHPLSGSIKPNETPYKSIMISLEKGELDVDGIQIIEESILTTNKFQDKKPTPSWPEKILDDFRIIDFSLMENTFKMLL